MRMASPQCYANPPTLNLAGGEGRVLDDGFGGIAAYIAGSTKSKAADILVSDIFDNTYRPSTRAPKCSSPLLGLLTVN